VALRSRPPPPEPRDDVAREAAILAARITQVREAERQQCLDELLAVAEFEPSPVVAALVRDVALHLARGHPGLRLPDFPRSRAVIDITPWTGRRGLPSPA